MNLFYCKERYKLDNFNWSELSVKSEIEYSKALGGEVIEFDGFIHIYNRFVPWNGDFNRVVRAEVKDFDSFMNIVNKTEKVHMEKGLESPNRYDIAPPALDEIKWSDFLKNRGFELETVIFYKGKVEKRDLPSDLRLYSPTRQEFKDWYYHLEKSKSYFDEEWFRKNLLIKLKFIEIFTPFWLMKGEEILGWVYCGCFGEYCRLFNVEIDKRYRHRGFGREMLNAVGNECGTKGAKFILLQSTERLRGFYEKSGFKECSRNTVIWKR